MVMLMVICAILAGFCINQSEKPAEVSRSPAGKKRVVAVLELWGRVLPDAAGAWQDLGKVKAQVFESQKEE